MTPGVINTHQIHNWITGGPAIKVGPLALAVAQELVDSGVARWSTRRCTKEAGPQWPSFTELEILVGREPRADHELFELLLVARATHRLR